VAVALTFTLFHVRQPQKAAKVTTIPVLQQAPDMSQNPKSDKSQISKQCKPDHLTSEKQQQSKLPPTTSVALNTARLRTMSFALPEIEIVHI
jgi:hypothetical protein